MSNDSKLANEPFQMPIDDVFSIEGRGTVARGLIQNGIIKTGEQVDLIGLNAEKLTTVVTGIEMFNKMVGEARAGLRVGLVLRDIRREDILRGMVIRKSEYVNLPQ